MTRARDGNGCSRIVLTGAGDAATDDAGDASGARRKRRRSIGRATAAR
jgi:hypothetical protein